MEELKNLHRGFLLAATFVVLAIIFAYGAVWRVSAQNHGDSKSHNVAEPAKLHDMACELRLGMTREEVEKALGKPKYSPAIRVFYYDSGATDENGVPLGIVVDYKRQRTKEGEDAKYTGKLEEYRVGRIAE
jgi:hypothetical protein